MKDYVIQSNESLEVLRLIFPSARAGHGPCHTFMESCPQAVLRTYRVVIQPESSGCEYQCLAAVPTTDKSTAREMTRAAGAL